MKKKERIAARQWILHYRSPLIVERTDFSGGWTGWNAGGIGVITETPDETWPEDIRQWYIARRDANLLMICPMCSAPAPLVMTGVPGQHGSMIHETNCVIGDDGFKEVFGYLPLHGNTR